MKEAWWVNYETGRIVPVKEHETAIRTVTVSVGLRVPAAVFETFKNYTPVTDRIRFLTDLMKQVPLMRVRGHGECATLEYWSEAGDEKPYAAVAKWAAKNAGPGLVLNVTNLATDRRVQVPASQWRG